MATYIFLKSIWEICYLYQIFSIYIYFDLIIFALIVHSTSLYTLYSFIILNFFTINLHHVFRFFIALQNIYGIYTLPTTTAKASKTLLSTISLSKYLLELKTVDFTYFLFTYFYFYFYFRLKKRGLAWYHTSVTSHSYIITYY